MSEFRNPYHFVPADSAPVGSVPISEFEVPKKETAPPPRAHPHITHDQFVPGTHSGSITCRVTVETPMICGNRQEERENWTKMLHPFSLDHGVTPSIPGSALRGMISAIAEAVSASALRVLKDTPLSHRMAAAAESLSAIGLLVETRRPDGSTELRLQPLTVPTVAFTSVPNLDCGPDEFPAEYTTMFPSRSPQPLLRAYVEGYQRQIGANGNPPTVALRRGTFIATQNPNSHSADHQEFWYAKLVGTVVLVGRKVVAAAGVRNSYNNRFLLAQQIEGAPISQDEYDALLPAEQKGEYTRGFLRVLGIGGRKDDMPTTKKHESFIPYPLGSETISTFPAAAAIEQFHRLADQRTETDPDLPFEVTGSLRNASPGPHSRKLRLRAGDLVFFRPDKETPGIVAEVSVSSIWRAGNGSVFEYFADLHPDLLPLAPDRNAITLAEQLFGTVEIRDSKLEKKPRDKPTFALASRLQVHHAKLEFAPTEGAWQPTAELLSPAQLGAMAQRNLPDYPLKNLASPKLPSPALYFKPKLTPPAYVAKRILKKGSHAPQGRKFYLRRNPITFSASSAFVHPGRFPDDRQSIANQHQSVDKFVRPATTFTFLIGFTNLSHLELQLIAYALQPCETFRHQIGHGKPFGFGQVHIEIQSVQTIDRKKRYALDSLIDTRWHNTLPHADLIAAYQTWAARKGLGPVLEALELLGSPPVDDIPIHYPHIEGIGIDFVGFERELFKWFMTNEDTSNHRQPGQFLRPLIDEKGNILRRLPKLERCQKEFPPTTAYQAPQRQEELPVENAAQLRDKIVTATAGNAIRDGRVPFTITHAGKTFPNFTGYFEVGKFERSSFAAKYPPGTQVQTKVTNPQGNHCTLSLL